MLAGDVEAGKARLSATGIYRHGFEADHWTVVRRLYEH